MSWSEFWNDKKKEIVMALTVAGAIVTLFTGVVFVEDRYLHAADFSQHIQQQQQVYEEIREDQANYRAQQIEDKLFELEFKEQEGTATSLDRALKNRYLLQLERIQ